MNADPWELMALPRDATPRDVKRRYAQLLKLNRPDENPGGFQMLRWAYEICLAHADSALVAASDPAFTTKREVAVFEPQPPPSPAFDPLPEAAPRDVEPFARRTPPAAPPVVAHDWFGLDRLDALRSPVAVVDELLAAADPARGDGDAFDAWFARCPELSNFAAREAIELELLVRLATSDVQLSYESFSTLEQSYNWSQIGFERRLVAGGMSPALVQRVVAALDHCLVDAQFSRHMAEREALFKRTPERWHAVLGDPDAERAELRRLHAERAQPRWRWLRALKPSVVNVVNQLFYAYTARCGAAAVDRLFGNEAVQFWHRAHPGTPPNLVQIGLSALRWLAGFVAFGLVASAVVVGSDDPRLDEALRNLWLGVLVSATIAVAGSTALRWTRLVAVPRFAQWREKFRQDVEAYLQPHLAVPVLVVATFVGASGAANLGAGWLAFMALTVVGVVLGRRAAIGAAVVICFGRGAISNLLGNEAFAHGMVAALLPVTAWLCDRIAVRTTGWPNAPEGAREQHTMWLLIGIGLAALATSVLWGPHATGA